MPVFRAAVRLIFRYPIYLFTYLIGFGLLGMVIAGTLNTVSETSFDQARPKAAVIDRDGSPLAQALRDRLNTDAELVEIADDTQALQDAVATNQASYLVIVPAGYAQSYWDALDGGVAPPAVEVVASFASASARYLDEVTNAYLSLVRAAYLGTGDPATALSQAELLSAYEVQVEVIDVTEAEIMPSALEFFLEWSAYPLMVSIMALVASLFAHFTTGAVRNRVAVTPMSTTRMNLQVSVAAGVVAVLAWGWIALLSLTPINEGVQFLTSNPVSYLLLLAAMLGFALVPVGFGFLLSQLRPSSGAINSASNIFGLVCAFLGGVFVPLSILGPGIQVLGRCFPTYWYLEALNAAGSYGQPGWQASELLVPIAVMLAFAFGATAIGLWLAYGRVQTVDAGGNTETGESE